MFYKFKKQFDQIIQIGLIIFYDKYLIVWSNLFPKLNFIKIIPQLEYTGNDPYWLTIRPKLGLLLDLFCESIGST